MDPSEKTNDDEKQDAAEIAKDAGFDECADLLRGLHPAAAVDVVNIAHELIDQAMNKASKDSSEWQKILQKLDKYPKAAKRPGKRRFSLLHTAAYQGQER